jgi:hypothetical protein
MPVCGKWQPQSILSSDLSYSVHRCHWSNEKNDDDALLSLVTFFELKVVSGVEIQIFHNIHTTRPTPNHHEVQNVSSFCMAHGVIKAACVTKKSYSGEFTYDVRGWVPMQENVISILEGLNCCT